MTRPRYNLTEGDAGRVLLRMTFHMIWGLLAMMTFNVIDTFFIGQLGPTPLAAIGFTFPVVFIVSGSAMGIGIGLSSVVSRAIGEGAHHKVAEITTRGLLLAFVIVTAFAVTGLTFHDQIFSLLGADAPMIALIREYMIPLFMGIGLLVIPMVGNSALRASGDTFTPSMIMMIAGVLNVILDPLLIFGIGPFPRLELQGAALATVLSYMVTFVAASWILIRRENMIHFHWPALGELLGTWRQILYIGLPAIGTNLMMPIANGILTRIMSGYGPLAVAALGVGTRIESLAMVGCFALSTATAGFAGQNIGARRYDRIRDGMRFGLKYCLCISTTVWVATFFFAEPIAGLFTDDAEIIRIVRPFLMLVPLSYAAFGYMLQTASCFNAAGRPKYSVIIFTTRLFVFTVPLALLGSHLAGTIGVFVAMFIGNIGTGTLAYVLMHRALKQPERML